MKSGRMQGWVFGMYGENRNTYRVWGGDLRKEPLGRPRQKWKDNVENVLHGLIRLAEDRDKWHACEHGNEPSGSIKCGELPD
jgi:hypothetical protein